MVLESLFGSNDDDETVEERTPFNLQVGDMIEYNNKDFIIQGRYKFDQDGWIWYEYRMNTEDDEPLWLVAEEDGGVTNLTFYRPIPLSDIEEKNDTVIYDETTYTLDEEGDASATLTTESSTRELSCHYRDFSSDDGELLSIENFGDSKEASIGETISEHQLELYPG